MNRIIKYTGIFLIIISIILAYSRYKHSQELLLVDAIASNNITMAEQLIQKGVNPNIRNSKTGITGLAMAIDKGNLKLVKLILEKYPQSTTAWGTPLDYAIFTYLARVGVSTSKIKDIIEYMVELKIPNKEQPLILAAIITGNLELIKNIATSLNIKNISDYDLYHIRGAAIMTNNKEILSYVVETIPNLANLKFERWTFLQQAIENGNPDIVEYVLTNTKSDINEDIGKKYEKTPFQAAIYKGNLKIIELLIKNGADLDPQHYEQENSPLEIAKKTNNPEIINLIQKHSRK